MRSVFSVLAVLVGLQVQWPTVDAAERAKPNFILIFCDNLGYGDIEPFGSTVHKTPHLNRMAREGRKFTHFNVTSGVCTPSRASIMTGCYAQRVGMHDNPRDGHVLRPVSPFGLAPSEITIAESLKSLGYSTAIFGKWHLGDQPQFLPTRQGFDYFFGIPYSDDMTRTVGLRIGERLQGNQWPELPLMQNESVLEAPTDRDLLTKRTTDEVLAFIEQKKDEPFFIYFPQCMPGSTSAPFASPKFKGKSSNGPWGDSIEEIDWSTGQILDELTELQIEKNTLVVWLSDNGAPLAKDMNSVARGSNKPLFGRGYTTSEGAFRSPTLMWWPETIPVNSTCDELATTMDFLPTFTTLAGGTVRHAIDGHDISALLSDDRVAESPYEVFYYYYRDQLQAVRQGPWKLFVPVKSFVRHPHFKKGRSAEPLLFNVVEDVSSANNVAEQHPAIVNRLSILADAARRDLGDTGVRGIGQRAIGRIKGDPQPIVIP